MPSPVLILPLPLATSSSAFPSPLARPAASELRPQAAFGWGAPVYAALLSARAASAFVQMMVLGKVVPLIGGHVPLALLASVVGATGAFLSVFAAVGVQSVELGGEGQVGSPAIATLFCAGLVLQYLVTGFATGVAAPAISALGDSSVQVTATLIAAQMTALIADCSLPWSPRLIVADMPPWPPRRPPRRRAASWACTRASRWVGAWAGRSSLRSSTSSHRSTPAYCR